jgi:Leucine-rich repeat (LRR) protein
LLVPAAAVLVLLVLPGDRTNVKYVMIGTFPGEQWTFEHGWPCVWLNWNVAYRSSSTPGGPAFGIPWLYQPAWGFRGDVREFRPGMLAMDVLVVLLLLGLIAAAVEWRRRRRHHFWQFSLTGVIALTALIAGGLGWCQYNKLEHDRELRLFANEHPMSPYANLNGAEYQGPVWLRRLAGETNLPALHRVTSAFFRGVEFGDEELNRCARELKTFSALDSLSIGGNVTDAGLASLEGLSQLRVLNLSYRSITDAGLAHVEKLGNLRELGLGGTDITGEGLKHLRGLEHLETLYLEATDIDDASLAHLSGLTNLRYLELSGTNLSGSRLLHLKNLDKLECVVMTNTEVKMAYIEQLNKALPDCHVLTLNFLPGAGP